MTNEKIARINELYKKSEAEGLSEEEKKEQALLRQEYVASVKANLRNQLNNIDMMMQMDLWKILEKNMDQKQELRKRMKEKRDRISPQERRQKSAKICERLLSAPEYARFQKILVYAAIRSEVELQLFCDQALRDKKQIFFPKVWAGKEMEFYRIEEFRTVKKGNVFCPGTRMSNNIRFLLLQRMGRHGFLSPVLHSTKRGCGSDTEEDFTIVT